MKTPPVVAVIGRPPVLRVGHQRIEVFLQSLQVKFLEFLSVVERLAHGIAHVRVLMKNLEVQLVRPPIPDRRATAGCLFARSARDRALTVFIHTVSSFRYVSFESVYGFILLLVYLVMSSTTVKVPDPLSCMAALGDHLSIEVGQFLEEPDIL